MDSSNSGENRVKLEFKQKMKFTFNMALAQNYHSNSQKIRILTEDWTKRNLYCPICGTPSLSRYENNHPTGDFFCENCTSDFELKSKKSDSGKLSKTIADGEYATMISRITSLQNPNFFFMTYKDFTVTNFIFIPNYFFTPDIIIKRNPLSANARRSGWTGCNINISGIPDLAKIFIIKNQTELTHETVLLQYSKAKTLKTNNLVSRGWLLDTLHCIERIPEKEFSLQQVYSFIPELKIKYPENNFIKDKLRQQLQYLRDKGFVQFLGNGHYRKI